MITQVFRVCNFGFWYVIFVVLHRVSRALATTDRLVAISTHPCDVALWITIGMFKDGFKPDIMMSYCGLIMFVANFDLSI